MPSAVRDQRARARAAPRADRHAVALGPVDEVGDDQEVAGEAHLDDRLHLEFEARDVFRPRCARARRRRDRGAASRAPGPRCASLRRYSSSDTPSGVGKCGQLVLAQLEASGCSASRSRRVFASAAGMSAKQLRHLVLRLEILLRREALRTARIARGRRPRRCTRALRARGNRRGVTNCTGCVATTGSASVARRARTAGCGQRVVVAAAGALHLEVEALREKLAPSARGGARRDRLPCASAMPMSPPCAPDSAIRPSVPLGEPLALALRRGRDTGCVR